MIEQELSNAFRRQLAAMRDGDPFNLGTMAHARIIENGEAGFRLHANVDGLRSILMRA